MLRTLAVLTVLLTFCTYVEPQTCGPVAEGQSITLTCALDTSSCTTNALTWTNGAAHGSIVATCGANGCDGEYIRQNYFLATYTTTSSTLTINNVSRTEPFDTAKSGWSCRRCSGTSVAACSYLSVYANPENPSCMVKEESSSVRITCTATKIYPAGRCSFFRSENGNAFTRITRISSYNSPKLDLIPIYYSLWCSLHLPMAEMGEGTHSFRAIVYPNRDGGENLVDGPTPVDANVTLSFPEVYYTCSPAAVQGYFPGDTVSCNCLYKFSGKPSGRGYWYNGDNRVGASTNLRFTFDSSDSEPVYTCDAVSALGRKVGSSLRPKFAYLSFTKSPSQTTFNKGDPLMLNCSIQGNLDPTSLTLARKRPIANEILASGQQASEAIHLFDSLDCMDTDVYVCSAPSTPAPSQEIGIGVKCPHQLSPSTNPTNSILADIGENAFISIEVYGFPAPNAISLKKINDATELKLSPRHRVAYTATTAPSGFVAVSVSDLEKPDFTDYSLSIGNGVGDPMVYRFSISQANEPSTKPALDDPESSSKDSEEDTLAIIDTVIGGISLVILTALLVLFIILVRTLRMKQKKGSQYKVDEDTTASTQASDCGSAEPKQTKGIVGRKAIPALLPPSKQHDYVDMSRRLATEASKESYETVHGEAGHNDETPASGHGYDYASSPGDEEEQEVYNNWSPYAEESVYGNVETQDGTYNNTR